MARLAVSSRIWVLLLVFAGCGNLDTTEVASSNVGINDVDLPCASVSLDGYAPPEVLDREVDTAIDQIVISDVTSDYSSIRALFEKYIDDQRATKYVLERIREHAHESDFFYAVAWATWLVLDDNRLDDLSWREKCYLNNICDTLPDNSYPENIYEACPLGGLNPFTY